MSQGDHLVQDPLHVHGTENTSVVERDPRPHDPGIGDVLTEAVSPPIDGSPPGRVLGHDSALASRDATCLEPLRHDPSQACEIEIPDCVVYAVRAGVNPKPSLAAVDAFRYQRRVLFLEPWSDIYQTDEERIMSFDDTVSFSEELRDVYERCGYILVHVPRGSIDDRAAFVREFIARRT